MHSCLIRSINSIFINWSQCFRIHQSAWKSNCDRFIEWLVGWETSHSICQLNCNQRVDWLKKLLVEWILARSQNVLSPKCSQFLKESTGRTFLANKICVFARKQFTGSLLTLVQPLRIHYMRWINIQKSSFEECWGKRYWYLYKEGWYQTKKKKNLSAALRVFPWQAREQRCLSIEGRRDVVTFIGSPISGTHHIVPTFIGCCHNSRGPPRQ